MVAQTRSLPSPRNSAEPKYLTPRTPNRPTFGHDVAAIAEELGQPFMPWQQHWALVCGEMIRDPETGVWVPAYPEAFVTVMRQNGKTLWELAHELHRAVLWEAYDRKPQALAYSGQSGSMARQKFRKEHWPLIDNSPMRAAVSRPRFAAEDTGIDFVNGSILTIWSSSQDAGHSLTVDLVAMDEIWADIDDRREQAALPAMATRHDRQKILASTGGTDKSVLYLRKQAAGRSTVTEGRTEGMAYCEFAFDRDDDPEDPKTWRANMPALGYTITERTVQAALDEMRGEDGDLSEFCRAWGNVTKKTGGMRVIPANLWEDVLGDAKPDGPLTFAVDASPDQTSAAIAVCDREGRAELINYHSRVGWCLDRLDQLAHRHDAPVVIDMASPAAFLADPLEDRGVEVDRLGTKEMTAACATFMTRLADRRIQVRRLAPQMQDPLDAAVEGARKRPVVDAWLWARKSADVDLCPLVALTMAVARSDHQTDDGPLVVVT